MIVRDMERAARWYESSLGCKPADEGLGWVALLFPDGSGFELFEGDPRRPGLSFPSYGNDHGPPVMPGFALEDADDAAANLVVARRLPGWVVVVSPDGTRLVLANAEAEARTGITGFRMTSPDARAQQAFMDALRLPVAVTTGPASVVPVVCGSADERLEDPDGNAVVLLSPSTMDSDPILRFTGA